MSKIRRPTENGAMGSTTTMDVSLFFDFIVLLSACFLFSLNFPVYEYWMFVSLFGFSTCLVNYLGFY